MGVGAPEGEAVAAAPVSDREGDREGVPVPVPVPVPDREGVPVPVPDREGVGACEPLAVGVTDTEATSEPVCVLVRVFEGVTEGVGVGVPDGVPVLELEGVGVLGGVEEGVHEREPEGVGVLEAEGLANAVSESDSACQLAFVLTPTAERVTCAPAESPVGAVQAAAAEAFKAGLTWVTPLLGLPQTACAVASPATGATKPLAELEL